MGNIGDGINHPADMHLLLTADSVENRIVRMAPETFIISPKDAGEINRRQSRRLGRVELTEIEAEIVRARDLCCDDSPQVVRIIGCPNLIDLQGEKLGPCRLEMRRRGEDLLEQFDLRAVVEV